MKKKLRFSVFFTLLVISSQADNRYWVGGTGTWNNSLHWSNTSGGQGGATVPSAADDVIFDQHSFSSAKQTVMLTADAVCHTMNWSEIDEQAIFSSASARKLTVTGSYYLSPLLLNGFKGQTIFSAFSADNVINTHGKTIIGNWIFNGNGSWTLGDEINTEPHVEIYLLKGSLNTNDKKIVCGSFIGNSSQPRSLTLGGSEIIIRDSWDFSSPGQLNFNSGASRIIFESKLDDEHFKSGGLVYNSVSPQTTFCSPSGTPCVPDLVITLSGTNVTCNGLLNGSATVVSVTGGSGAYSYLWNPGGLTTQTISGLGPGTYTVRVTDVNTSQFCFCSVQITEPGVLFNYELYNTQPTCNGNCDGEAAVDATGGTFPYNYTWSPVGGTNDTATNLCANTYTILVTDANGCTANTTIMLGQPNVLVAPGSSTNVTCNGNCDGTASVVASGGTLPYAYDWTPGNPTGDGTANITNLCPGTYTCTVTDANNCVATYTTLVTQPNVLTLAATNTNASCGGTCDGTATATVSGGTTPYTYVWSTGATTTTPSTGNTVSSLCAGIYTITVTDANGCSQSAIVTVTEPPVLVATAGGIDITCFNACNGTATATVTGGTSPFTYVWSTGATTSSTPSLTDTINALCAGTYSVTVTDLNGCVDTGLVILTEPALLIANPTGTNISCFGNCNGSIVAAPAGGTAPYIYDWSPGAPTGDGTPSITNLCPGTYSVLVTDANGCDTVQSVTITQPTQLTASASGTNLSCNSVCNGTTNVTPAGGTSPYNYLWNTGATTSGLTNQCAGTYSVTVTDNSGCSATASVTLSQPNLLSVNLLSTQLACNGDCDATITATVAGGTPVYTYLWAPGGETISSVSNKCAGSYTVTINDANSCTATNSVVITQPTALTMTTPPPKTDVSCFSLCDGVLAALAGGGTPTYSYLWAPGGQTTSSISNQCAGTYTITLSDANGCNLTDTISISQPPPLLANPSVVNHVTCTGGCNGSATSVPTGGTAPYTYSWAPGSPTGDGTPTVTGLCAGNYNVMVTDANSCSSTMPVTITQPVVLSAAISNSTSSCNICNGTATVTPAGGTGSSYSYLWTPTGQTTQTATGLCPNTSYTVTVTDQSGCTATSAVTILQTITITITTSNTVLSCNGACDGVVTANASGGTAPYGYIWSGPSGIVSLTQTASNLCAGSYTVDVSDSLGCFNSSTVTFTDPPLLNVSITKTDVTCNGACNGTATATPTGGTGAYSYSWSPGGQTSQTATGLCAGSYTATVTDANGCVDTAQITITEPTAVTDNLVNIDSANCNISDGTITVAPSGGTGVYTYDWGPGTPTGDGTPGISNLSAGTYTLTITDGAGCTFGFTYLLSNKAGPSLTVSHTNASCTDACDGTATVTATGGTGLLTYLWSPGGQTTSAATALCGTTLYTIQVTDALGCISLDTATVINPTLISPNPTVVNESCGGTCDGSISLAPTGGAGAYTYLWAPGGQTTSSITNLCASTYTVTVTDASGCDSVLVISIVSPPALTATLSSTDVQCNGDCDGTATVTAAGGTGAGTYTYSWSHGAFVLPSVVNLCPGQYIVTVSDGNLCTAKDTVNITEPPVLTAVTSQINISCSGSCSGIAIVSASGGTLPYTYLWNPGSVANDTASNLCAGTYNATVTDVNGCIVTPPAVVISQPTSITVNATFVNPNCNGACDGTATVSVTGGTAPYTYLWMPGNLTTQSVGNLCAGTYTVTVTDALSCSNNQIITLVDPAILSANSSFTPPSCANGCNGSATANPVGGTTGYTYLWSPGNLTSQSITNLCPATYTVVVTDSKNCTNQQTVTVTNPAPIDAVIGSTPSTCGLCDGTITITPTTGTSPYTYLWSPAPTIGQGTSFGDSVCAGIYNITVTDVNGCDSTFVATMNNSSGPTGETVSVVNLSCNSVCNGSGSVAPVGGLPPYTYLWNDIPGTTNDTAINLCAGNYFVEVTDANGCIRFSPVTITEPTPIIVNGTVTDATCIGVCNGAITITSSGGTGAHVYNWSPVPGVGQGTASVSSLCTGTYTLTITDAGLCVKTATFVIGQTAPLIATISSTSNSCASLCTAMSYVTISSGTAPYFIQWDDPLGQANDTATALCAGTYNVNITDIMGCVGSLTTTITAPAAVTANPSITNALCGACDGQIVLAPSGGTSPYIYLWSNGNTSGTATALCAGLHSVDITDSAGCVTNVSIPVSNSGGPSSATITATNISCFGLCDGAVTGVTPVGGTSPYSYLWVHNGQTTTTLANLCAGTYYIQITDARGCSLTDSVIITEPSQIMANDSVRTATCNVCDGSISIAPGGGIAPYTVLWNTGSSAQSLTNLCAGIYSVRITASNGCYEDVVIPLSSQNGPTLTTSSTNILCNGSCNGSAGVTAIGGTTPYDYLWNDIAAQTTSVASSLCEGNYFVQVTDGANCVTISSVAITAPLPIGFSTASVSNPQCTGDANGSITVLPSGGTLPYSYSWAPTGGTNFIASGLSAGSYTVTLTDGNGCSASQTATLTNPSLIAITAVTTNASCNTISDGAIDITVTGGTPGYTYQWSGGSTATTQDISGLLVGITTAYTLTVTDTAGCVSDTAFVLTSTLIVTANAGNDTTFCQSGSITLDASLSTNAVNYQWFEIPSNSIVGNTAIIAINPPPGVISYYVIVDNGSGCTDSDTVQITINPLPAADAGPDVTIISGKTATLGGNPTGPAGSTYLWIPSLDLDNATSPNPVATPTVTTTYTVIVTSLLGCSATDSMVVTVYPEIIFPTGISPNGDGINDEWIIDGIELFPDCIVEVYNRWGELLFQSPGYKEKWDGTYKGSPLPVGTYYYIINLNDPLYPDTYTGPVTILR